MRGAGVLFRKTLGVQVNTVCPEGIMVVLDVTRVSKQSFKLLAVYVHKQSREADFYREMENFLSTSKFLVVLGVLKTDLNHGWIVLARLKVEKPWLQKTTRKL